MGGPGGLSVWPAVVTARGSMVGLYGVPARSDAPRVGPLDTGSTGLFAVPPVSRCRGILAIYLALMSSPAVPFIYRQTAVIIWTTSTICLQPNIVHLRLPVSSPK